MLTNAMFYEIGGTSDPSTTLKLGPFEFSPAQIGIGVMSSLVIFPVNLLIVGESVFMFSNAKCINVCYSSCKQLCYKKSVKHV